MSENKIEKNNNEKRLKIIILILTIIILFLGGYIYYDKILKSNDNNNIIGENSQNKNDNNKENKQEESNNSEEKTIYIVKDETTKEKKYLTEDYNMIKNKDDILGEYKCTNCYAEYPYQYALGYHFIGESSVLIYDDPQDLTGDLAEKIVRYNYVTKKIEDTYDVSVDGYELSNDNYAIAVKKNKKYGFLDKNGNMITNYEYEELPNGKLNAHAYDRKYSDWYGPNALVRVKKDKKYGILNIETGKVIVDIKYEDIIISPNGYYSIKENNKWYLFDKNLKKVLTNGYDGIFACDFGILVLENPEGMKLNVRIIDYNDKDVSNVVEIKDVTLFSQHNAANSLNLFYNGLLYQEEKNKINISFGIIEKTFEYDLNKKILNVIEQEYN